MGSLTCNVSKGNGVPTEYFELVGIREENSVLGPRLRNLSIFSSLQV